MGYSEADYSDRLLAAACETLETLAFTEVVPRKENGLTGPAGTYLGSRIQLGTLGSLDLIIGRDFLEDLGRVLFNPHWGPSDEDALADALKEIANIIGGRFLNSLFQGESDFAMGLPQVHLDLPGWNALGVRFVLAAEDGKVLGVGINPAIHGK